MENFKEMGLGLNVRSKNGRNNGECDTLLCTVHFTNDFLLNPSKKSSKLGAITDEETERD